MARSVSTRYFGDNLIWCKQMLLLPPKNIYNPMLIPLANFSYYLPMKKRRNEWLIPINCWISRKLTCASIIMWFHLIPSRQSSYLASSPCPSHLHNYENSLLFFFNLISRPQSQFVFNIHGSAGKSACKNDNPQHKYYVTCPLCHFPDRFLNTLQ